MGTWTSFYLQTRNAEAVAAKLGALCPDLTISTPADFPADMGDYQLLSNEREPNYMAVCNTQGDWTTVVHNSFSKLETWGSQLSRELDCCVIMIMAQTVTDSYYFAMYEKGNLRREIETCYSTDFEEVNTGEIFHFEGPSPGIKVNLDGEESYIFDFEAMEEYCSHFDLRIYEDYSAHRWTVLKGSNLRMEIKEFIQQHTAKKPWWKFW